MQQNFILAYHAPIWKFGPGPPKMEFFKIFSFLWKGLQILFQTSPQPPQILSLSQVMQENLILAYYAPIWKFGPEPPKLEFFKFFSFYGKVSRFRFQLALNHPQALSLNQVMQENVILAYYAQIWKFGPRLPKMEFFNKFSFF